MRVDIVTLFPEMLESVVSHSILKRAQEKGLLDVRAVDLRAFTTDRHKMADDSPFGGGAGMVMKPEPLVAAIEYLRPQVSAPRVILTSPRGAVYNQRRAEEFARESHLILLCGRYEGVDERVRAFITDDLSIGDYVLSGGELAALNVLDSVARLIPGVLGKEESAAEDSFTTGLLEHPHYTRPADFRGMTVPEVLLSGHHANVERWRREQSLRLTREHRPDLFASAPLTEADRRLLAQWDEENFGF
ncbi:MAG: tRNA (guanosine(37)-N1)-methyltransferase TrmD [Armatimonadetes bacterium]|nr:tRNA (guanosine(37)-N1)-methyltransferase TrmD [Armatimonadota bacterium]